LTCAASFQRWVTNEFGAECDLLGFSASGRCLKHWKFTGSDKLLKVFKMEDFYDVVNSYDAAYFPYAAIQWGKQTPIHFDFSENLKVPFMVGVHDESYSLEYSRLGYYDQAARNPKFRGFTTVSYVEPYFLPKSPYFYWHPCTLPEYLLKEDTNFPDIQKDGMIFYGRLCYWKKLDLLAQITLNPEILESLQGRVTVIGSVSGRSHYFLVQKLEKMNPQWELVSDAKLSAVDVDEMKSIYSGFRYFWEVVDDKSGEWYLKRFNLVAIESMSQGCIPVVSPYFSPEWTHEFSIVFSKERLMSGDFLSDLRKANSEIELRRSRMKEIILNSEWSFESVKSQVARILESLLS